MFVASGDGDFGVLFDCVAVLAGDGGWHGEGAFVLCGACDVEGFVVGVDLYAFGCGSGAEVGGGG